MMIKLLGGMKSWKWKFGVFEMWKRFEKVERRTWREIALEGKIIPCCFFIHIEKQSKY